MANSEMQFWLDREKFFEFGRTLQRNWHSSDLGEVSFAVKAGKLLIQSKRGGTEIPCEGEGEISATMTAPRFRKLIFSQRHIGKPSGKMPLVFRPQFGEVAIDVAGVKAKFG